MTLKSTLKSLKLNESRISTILGVVVVLVAAVFVVNYFRERGITLPGLNTSQPAENNTNTGEKTHVVVKGENLWQIAQKEYGDGYKWSDIAKANSLINANQIEEGQSLKLPDLSQNLSQANTGEKQTVEPTVQPSPVAESPKPTTIASENIGEKVTVQEITGTNYTVLKGDSLWKISVRAYGDGYKWTEVWNANKSLISNPNLIYPDTALTLPR
ncbi:LysM peptidoglycan-binding domain-containing protein [Candidatus Woesebacteria bacterium]|nr:LysM peptidoglycan-binding domain-containing protein [Candidatus Woesebacteria bacterium]